MKQRDNIDEEEEVEIDCDVEINNFLPYYYKATSTFSDIKDDLDLALYIITYLVEGVTDQHLNNLYFANNQ